jgi:hypothetical protein
MKALYMLALGALCLIPTIAGTTVASAEGAVPVAAAYESVNLNVQSLALLKAQSAASNGMLSRPL